MTEPRFGSISGPPLPFCWLATRLPAVPSVVSSVDWLTDALIDCRSVWFSMMCWTGLDPFAFCLIPWDAALRLAQTKMRIIALALQPFELMKLILYRHGRVINNSRNSSKSCYLSNGPQTDQITQARPGQASAIHGMSSRAFDKFVSAINF